MSVIPASPSLPSLSVCLLSHSGLRSHNHATDSLAVYLQAFCACDVTYFRWQSEDIRFVGPEAWTVEQMDKADRVLFVHSPETDACYEAWRSGRPAERVGGDTAVRMLVAAFDRLSTAHNDASSQRRRKCFNVTFGSDLSGTSASRLLLLAPGGASPEGLARSGWDPQDSTGPAGLNRTRRTQQDPQPGRRRRKGKEAAVPRGQPRQAGAARRVPARTAPARTAPARRAPAGQRLVSACTA